MGFLDAGEVLVQKQQQGRSIAGENWRGKRFCGPAYVHIQGFEGCIWLLKKTNQKRNLLESAEFTKNATVSKAHFFELKSRNTNQSNQNNKRDGCIHAICF
jgi:hypothetical protein